MYKAYEERTDPYFLRNAGSAMRIVFVDGESQFPMNCVGSDFGLACAAALDQMGSAKLDRCVAEESMAFAGPRPWTKKVAEIVDREVARARWDYENPAF